jgi:hypothetical protein
MTRMTAAVTDREPVAAGGDGAASRDGWQTARQRQAAACDAYLASVTAGAPLSPATLGARFRRSRRWGSDRIAEATREHSSPSTNTTTASARQPIGNAGMPAAPQRAAVGSHPLPAQAADAAVTGAVSVAERRMTTLAVVAVVIVAAVTSYDHQRALAETAGEGWRSLLVPVSVDGLVIAASMVMLTRRRTGRRAGAIARVAFLLGVTAHRERRRGGAHPRGPPRRRLAPDRVVARLGAGPPATRPPSRPAPTAPPGLRAVTHPPSTGHSKGVEHTVGHDRTSPSCPGRAAIKDHATTCAEHLRRLRACLAGDTGLPGGAR